jgi:rod shape-determining protein MreD
VKLLKLLVILGAILLLQTMVLNRFRWIHFLDLFLLLNIYYALNSTEIAAMSLSLSSGFVQDAFSQGIIGLNAFSKTIVAYFISTLSSRLMIKHPLLIMLLIGVATFIDLLIIQGLRVLLRLGPVPLTQQTILIACALNMTVGIIVFQLIDRVFAQKEYA